MHLELIRCMCDLDHEIEEVEHKVDGVHGGADSLGSDANYPPSDQTVAAGALGGGGGGVREGASGTGDGGGV